MTDVQDALIESFRAAAQEDVHVERLLDRARRSGLRYRRRRRVAVTSCAALATTLIVGGVAVAGVRLDRGPGGVPVAADGSTRAPATVAPSRVGTDGTGLVVGNGPVRVELYLDLQCPACRGYWTDVRGVIGDYITTNKTTLTVHNVTFLDWASSGEYSSRAAAAAACAHDEGKLLGYLDALFRSMPAEGTAGPSDSRLIATGTAMGIGGSFPTCVSEHRYLSWVRHENDRANSRGVTGVPAVYVAHKKIGNTGGALAAAVDAAR